MTKRDKLIQKILTDKIVSFEDADKILIFLDYIPETPKSGSSHITYRKDPLAKITLVKNRKELKPYQMIMIQDALRKAGY
jgi:hypothetical protein